MLIKVHTGIPVAKIQPTKHEWLAPAATLGPCWPRNKLEIINVGAPWQDRGIAEKRGKTIF